MTPSLLTIGRRAVWEAIDNWPALDGQFRIESGTDKPDHASLCVKHRDHWFWMAESDVASRSRLRSEGAGAGSDPAAAVARWITSRNSLHTGAVLTVAP